MKRVEQLDVSMCGRFLAGALLCVIAACTLRVRAEAADASPSPSAAPTKEPGKKDKDDDVSPIFHLRDGGVVAAQPGFRTLTVRTRYGTLEVPVKELVEIRFARRVGAGVKKKVEKYLRQLGSEDFDERESAMESLRATGPDALPQLRGAAASENEEIRSRVEILIGEFDEKAAEDSAVASDLDPVKGVDDEVVTQKFTIKGEVLLSSFELKSRYGPLQIAAGDLVGIAFGHGGIVSKKVEVAGNFVVPSRWMKTKVSVSKGQVLRIQAQGQLHLSNYNITTGPQGTSRYQSSAYMNFPTQALVGKIGKQGKPFLVGAKYNGKASGTGELFLGVVPRRTYVATGSYKVKIESGGR